MLFGNMSLVTIVVPLRRVERGDAHAFPARGFCVDTFAGGSVQHLGMVIEQGSSLICHHFCNMSLWLKRLPWRLAESSLRLQLMCAFVALEATDNSSRSPPKRLVRKEMNFFHVLILYVLRGRSLKGSILTGQILKISQMLLQYSYCRIRH